MKFVTLFFNAMRISSKLDCRRFLVDANYGQMLERELRAGLVPVRVNRPTVGKAAAGTAWRTV